MAKLKDLLKENFSLVGGIVSTPVIGSGTNTGLTDIVEDMYGKSESRVSAKEVKEAISQFTQYSEVFQQEENLKKIAESLADIANKAKSYTLSETDDWFDKVTVNRNMKELTGLSKQFSKISNEAEALQQRMGALYEDMGNILGRYYEIGETHVRGHDSDDDETPNVEENRYEKFFQSAMKKFGISSPDELDDDKKKDFFNYVDKNYQAKNEKD